MIKAIIFDCFGVLTTESWQLFKTTLPADQEEAARSLMRQSAHGFISYEEFIQELAKLTNRPAQEVSQALRNDLSKNEPLLKYIGALKAEGYKIGLLSNIANNWIRDSFLSQQEQSLFDEMIMSFEVGIIKPDPRIFEMMCERLGVKAKESVLVDDVERYTDAARKTGMEAITYQDLSQFKAQLKPLLNHK